MNTLNIAKGAAATHQRRRARATTIPEHGNMGGTLPTAATQVWQDQGRVDEAALAAEEKHPSPPAEGSGCNPDQRWTYVSQRKSSKLDDIDSRSLIIWGVPHDIPAATVQQELLGRDHLSSACVSLWRGVGTNRHVVLAFTSVLCRMAVATAVSQRCKEFHWRSVDGRKWRTRESQRREADPARPTRKGGRAGKYSFLLPTDSQISPACTLGRRRAMFPAWGARHVTRELAAMVVVMMVVMIAVMVVACMGMATAGAAATVATQCGDRRGGLRQ